MIDVHWIHGRQEHRLSPFIDVFATRNQSRLNDRVRTVGASNVVDVLGEVARQQHVVLQCRIDVFSSRVAMNCSKEKDCISREWIHTILVSLLWSSSSFASNSA